MIVTSTLERDSTNEKQVLFRFILKQMASQICDHSKIRFIPIMHMVAFKKKKCHFRKLPITAALYVHVHTDIPHTSAAAPGLTNSLINLSVAVILLFF